MDGTWEVYALKYGEVATRRRADNFLGGDPHDGPMPLDYFTWVLRSGDRTILVDTGFEREEGARRGREIDREPHEALAPLGIAPETVDTVIITHLHYDHAGGLPRYPAATFHLQAAEMAFATGPCMCHPQLRHTFSVDHVCEMVRKVYAGRVIFHDGDAEVAPGVTVHRIGGHSLGLQAVRVRTREGWLCLASDASHYYANYLTGRPFPIVVDVAETLDGYARIRALASTPGLVIPGHDPLVRRLFPEVAGGFVFRLDATPRDFDPLSLA
ncbi:N-acyl homoserine lactonase family protein [Albimonas sp. CAU 1670]|uniref:N-acyl homoserine lactonase family protein n=1 Tax=Albimonas sp. CAU 1670 TaxID=3032599 RepID=UPI0023D9E259|nr:N-acyl homoserine lactonase family protein [Albimonas sp. CAU 1670]MDF2231889.1 N-acyl homoserine lactonase family protein [Albimonas sp. CAU 1670]